MALKLMYITNQKAIAQIAESAGVDRIFVDMEYIGKDMRQGGMNTVQNHHTIEDVKTIRSAIRKAQLLVRINPIHETSNMYESSKDEIDKAIEDGADFLMLPYFKTVEEVEAFLGMVNGRVKTVPLVETPEAVNVIDEILKLEGLDEIFVGLNDLSIGYGKRFMFELLSDGTVENLCHKFRNRGIPYGFGGIASLGKGLLPAEYIIKEHYRLGSTCAILSRSFCNLNQVDHMGEISLTFLNEIQNIRSLEVECERHCSFFIDNLITMQKRIKEISMKK